MRSTPRKKRTTGGVLRMRIRHHGAGEATRLYCEIRVDSSTEFTVLAEFDTDMYSMTCPYEVAPEFHRALPVIWRPEFAKMARQWAEVDYHIYYGSSRRTRYPDEPASSRDAFESDPDSEPLR